LNNLRPSIFSNTLSLDINVKSRAIAVAAIIASGVFIFLLRLKATHTSTVLLVIGITCASFTNDFMMASFALSLCNQDSASIYVITDILGTSLNTFDIKSIPLLVYIPAKKCDITLLSIKYRSILYA
jgi:hypothetical protein